MKIYLVRHGETTADVEDRYGGDYDDHLTEKGTKQAKDLAKVLSGKGIELIYHSPKIRAVETAQIVAAELKVPLFVMENFRERNNFGVLTGLTKAEGLEKFPSEVKKLEVDPKNHGVTASEGYNWFKQRVMRAFNAVINEEHKSVAIITHSGPIRVIMRELLKKEFATIGDCAVIELEETNGAIEIKSLDNAQLVN